ALSSLYVPHFVLLRCKDFTSLGWVRSPTNILRKQKKPKTVRYRQLILVTPRELRALQKAQTFTKTCGIPLYVTSTSCQTKTSIQYFYLGLTILSACPIAISISQRNRSNTSRSWKKNLTLHCLSSKRTSG